MVLSPAAIPLPSQPKANGSHAAAASAGVRLSAVPAAESLGAYHGTRQSSISIVANSSSQQCQSNNDPPRTASSPTDGKLPGGANEVSLVPSVSLVGVSSSKAGPAIRKSTRRRRQVDPSIIYQESASCSARGISQLHPNAGHHWHTPEKKKRKKKSQGRPSSWNDGDGYGGNAAAEQPAAAAASSNFVAAPAAAAVPSSNIAAALKALTGAKKNALSSSPRTPPRHPRASSSALADSTNTRYAKKSDGGIVAADDKIGNNAIAMDIDAAALPTQGSNSAKTSGSNSTVQHIGLPSKPEHRLTPSPKRTNLAKLEIDLVASMPEGGKQVAVSIKGPLAAIMPGGKEVAVKLRDTGFVDTAEPPNPGRPRRKAASKRIDYREVGREGMLECKNVAPEYTKRPSAASASRPTSSSGPSAASASRPTSGSGSTFPTDLSREYAVATMPTVDLCSGHSVHDGGLTCHICYGEEAEFAFQSLDDPDDALLLACADCKERNFGLQCSGVEEEEEEEEGM